MNKMQLDDITGMEEVIQQLCYPISTCKLQKLLQYVELLDRWTEKVNLIAPRDRKRLIMRHLIPALLIGNVVRMVLHRVIMDFGSGGGLPGIPLKIVLPDSVVILVESKRRKVHFIREVVRNLSLEQVEVVNERLENWKQPKRDVDIVVTRAVATPAQLVRQVRPYIADHGVVVTTLGPRGMELRQIPPLIFLMKKTTIWSEGEICLGMLGI